MPTPQDEEFVRFAMAGGHLTQEQADEALDALRSIEELGGSASAPEMLERRGLLDSRRIGLIHQAIAASKAATTVPGELGSFELLEKIGQGAMGSVFKARQKDRDRLVAIKILSPRLARNEEFVARFRREARAAARLSHPNIVGAIDVGESQGFHYFATEYVEGETLADVLRRERRLPEARAVAIATEVARALDHAHARGIVHRDIRPANIMVAADGSVRVTDFGLAKPIGRDAPSGDRERFLGTPAYVAPEQLRSEPDIDCRADIFSLGVTLFQMLTGGPPFKGSTPMAVAAAVLTDPLPSVRSVRPDVRIATACVVERAAAKDRSARFASPAELVAALESIAGVSRAAPRPAARAAARQAVGPAQARRAPRRRPRYAFAAFAVTVVGISLHVILFVWLFPNVLRRWDAQREAEQARRVPATAAAATTSVPLYVPPTPATPHTTTPAADVVPEKLRVAVAGAAESARRTPRAFASQIARYRQILADYSGERRRSLSPAGRKAVRDASEELQRLRDAVRTAALAELDQRRARAEALLKRNKVAEALGLFDTLPAELSTPGTAPELERFRDHCRQRALDMFGALDARGQKLVKQGSFEQAKGVYLPAKAWNVPEVTRRVDAAVVGIDRLIADREAGARKNALRAYPATVRTLVERLAARDYDGARKLLDAALVDPKLAPVHARLRPFRELARAAGEVWAHVGAGVKKLEPGALVRIGGLAGKFVRLEGDKVYVQAGAAVVARPLAELRGGEAVTFALSGYGSATPQVSAKIGLFLIAERDYEVARNRLAAAAEKGVNVVLGLGLLRRVAPRLCHTCKGKKAIPCPDCEGKGYTSVDRQRCEPCNGRGWFLCRKCRGRGVMQCGRCGGSGKIAGGFRCMDCGGSGRVDCASCKKGRVRCKHCKGKGESARYNICERCKGKKQIPCPDCGGKGELPPRDLVPQTRRE